MFHIEYNIALFPLEKTIFSRKNIENGKNMYDLILHPDYTNERKTFVHVGQETTILWQDTKILLKHLA